MNSLPRGGENAQVSIRAHRRAKHVRPWGEGISQISAVLQKQDTRVISVGARAGPVPGVHRAQSSTHLRGEL